MIVTVKQSERVSQELFQQTKNTIPEDMVSRFEGLENCAICSVMSNVFRIDFDGLHFRDEKCPTLDFIYTNYYKTHLHTHLNYECEGVFGQKILVY